MKKVIFLILMLFIPVVIDAEELIMDWQTSWGGNGTDEVSKIMPTSDGGYITFLRSYATILDENSSFDDISNYETVIVKYDKDGKLIWEINLSGNGNDYYYFDMTDEEELIVYGSSDSTDIDGITNKGYEDAIIAKYSSDGTLLWQNSWGGDMYDQFNSIEIDDDGSIIAFASSSSSNLDDDQVYGMSMSINNKVLKYDKDGKLLFQKSLGDDLDISNFDYNKTEEGNYVVWYSVYDFDNECFDLYLDKYDKSFDLLLHNKVSGPPNILFSNLIPISGEYIVYYLIDDINSENYGDLYLIKYDKNLNIVFENYFDIGFTGERVYITNGIFSNNGDSLFLGRVEIEDNGMYGAVGGVAVYYEYFLLKCNKAGNLLWKKALGNSKNNMFSGLLPLRENDGDFILSGMTIIDDGTPTEDDIHFVIFKYDLNGELKWQKNFKRNDLVSQYFDKEDETFTFFITSSSIDLEDVVNKGGVDSIILKYDKTGNLLWNQQFGGNGNDTVLDILYRDEYGFVVLYKTDSTDLIGVELDEGENTILIKYDNNGNVVWQKKYDDIYSFNEMLSLSEEVAFSVLKNQDNSFVFYGISDKTNIDGITNKGGHDVVIRKYSIKYDLEILESKNGTFKLEQSGQYGIINPSPDKGYEVDKIIVKDKDGNVLDVEVTELEDGTYSFELYTDVTVEVTFKETLFNPKTGEVNFKLCFYILIILSTFGFGYLYLFRRNSVL